MFNLRPAVSSVTEPLGRSLLGVGVTANAVTVAGTVASVAASLGLLARGHLFLGAVVVTLTVLTDALDGTMARMSGGSTRWGAFLDSSLDRFVDGAVLGSLAFWYATGGHDDVLCAVSLAALVLGSITSYVKARAQSVGMTCDVGIVERTERLVLALGACIFGGVGVPYVRPALLWVLLALSAVTVGQRLAEVRRQAVAA
ncbi:MAG: CDP-diacylglycerol--glycerol-3-phosphate 3-phosphatidyltransferase [Frankiales bacterium]|nr:CDP-diacylglycerol--glycerol-3-phosphate 3-phosphatidyltransferase [Frankiales bacterium]